MTDPTVTLEPSGFAEAVELLTRDDADLASVVANHGIPEMWGRPPGFPSLVLFILEQQVSLASGKAVFERLRRGLGEMTPEAVLAGGPAKIRDAGVTRQKTTYLLELSEALLAGRFDLAALTHVDDSTARSRLLELNGVGPWTADVYLLSCLRRPDMWPVGDRALQVGVGELLGLANPPDSVQLEAIGERWRPLRAVAARLIWHNYLRERGREEPEVAGL
ncbi:MAG: DNA-3-methyladenine glycosylase 2 family protein [Acidimicrobiia bacterium]|nr:DNA-3-methyladenine glycosylase 2 family protein [Acidimicrobiia bacterium]